MQISTTQLKELKMILRENDCPFFTDEELEYYASISKSLKETAYTCLIVKAENTALSVSGLDCGDTSKYFLRLAQKYRPNNSGILKGG